jgi:hypothetical protein
MTNRVDTLILARYGIFQPTIRRGPGAMTLMVPVSELDMEERRGLFEMACLAVDGPESRRPSRRKAAKAVAHDDDDDDRPFGDDEDERLIDEY